jgi:hypothetical protein
VLWVGVEDRLHFVSVGVGLSKGQFICICRAGQCVWAACVCVHCMMHDTEGAHCSGEAVLLLTWHTVYHLQAPPMCFQKPACVSEWRTVHPSRLYVNSKVGLDVLGS